MKDSVVQVAAEKLGAAGPATARGSSGPAAEKLGRYRGGGAAQHNPVANCHVRISAPLCSARTLLFPSYLAPHVTPEIVGVHKGARALYGAFQGRLKSDGSSPSTVRTWRVTGCQLPSSGSVPRDQGSFW